MRLGKVPILADGVELTQVYRSTQTFDISQLRKHDSRLTSATVEPVAFVTTLLIVVVNLHVTAHLRLGEFGLVKGSDSARSLEADLTSVHHVGLRHVLRAEKLLASIVTTEEGFGTRLSRVSDVRRRVVQFGRVVVVHV